MYYTRNALFFPNMQLLENQSLQVRVNRPLSASETEITTYCIAPKGESRAARTLRIRQYEEFYNPSGLATPDDTSDIALFSESGTQTLAVKPPLTINAGSFEHVLRWRRNSVTRLDAISAFCEASSSKASPVLAGDGPAGSSGGNPSIT